MRTLTFSEAWEQKLPMLAENPRVGEIHLRMMALTPSRNQHEMMHGFLLPYLQLLEHDRVIEEKIWAAFFRELKPQNRDEFQFNAQAMSNVINFGYPGYADGLRSYYLQAIRTVCKTEYPEGVANPYEKAVITYSKSASFISHLDRKSVPIFLATSDGDILVRLRVSRYTLLDVPTTARLLATMPKQFDLLYYSGISKLGVCIDFGYRIPGAELLKYLGDADVSGSREATPDFLTHIRERLAGLGINLESQIYADMMEVLR